MEAEVLFTPGHTLASITYVVGDAAFIHDTIFMPDGGTARADFPGGSARSSGTASSASWRCRTTPACSQATINAGRQKAGLGEHGRAAAGREHPPHESQHRGGVCGASRDA